MPSIAETINKIVHRPPERKRGRQQALPPDGQAAYYRNIVNKVDLAWSEPLNISVAEFGQRKQNN